MLKQKKKADPRSQVLRGTVEGRIRADAALLRCARTTYPQDSSLLSSLFSLLSFLCCLPSSLLGADPFLYHPALLGLCKNAVNLACADFLSSLLSLLSLLCSLPSSNRRAMLL